MAPRMFKGQLRFGNAAISPDHRTVGWLVVYPFPSPPGAQYVIEPIPRSLALYRGGRIIHLFNTDQVFWDWQFQYGGKHVAYSTGPTHGGAAECVLRNVDSGKVLGRWWVKDGGEAPVWARNLRV